MLLLHSFSGSRKCDFTRLKNINVNVMASRNLPEDEATFRLLEDRTPDGESSMEGEAQNMMVRGNANHARNGNGINSHPVLPRQISVNDSEIFSENFKFFLSCALFGVIIFAIVVVAFIVNPQI